MTDLAGAEHDNLVETFDFLAGSVAGGVVVHEGGVATIASGLPMRLFNQVFIEADDAAGAALERAVARMREVGAPWAVTLREGIDDRFGPIAERLGLVHDPHETFPGMAIKPLPEAMPDPAGLEIRRVETDGLADHAIVIERGFGIDRPLVDAIVSAAASADPRFTFYVGYVEGQPVVSGLAVLTGSTIGVYNIATIEEARRRGYGAAITRRILVDGAAAGGTVGTLQASDMGKPVYEALGFRTVITYRGYVEPDSAGASA